MSKFDGLILFSDLDGTLMRDDQTVSKENIDAVEYFMSQGGKFTVMTGRGVKGMSRVLDFVTPNVPYIGCLNGSAIYDFVNQNIVWNMSIDPYYIQIIKAIMSEVPDCGVEITTADEIYFVYENKYTDLHMQIEYLPHIKCAIDEHTDKAVKIVFAHCPEKLVQIASLIDKIENKDIFDYIIFLLSF